jgi:hypothetical protein
MIDESVLKELVHTPGISNQSRLLLCLAVTPVAPRKDAALRQMVVNAGVANASKLNIGEYLSRARTAGLARKLPAGWELTKPGVERVTGLIKQDTVDKAPPEPIKQLRDHLKLIKKEETRAFVEEAVQCAERKLFRSAVVFSWIGAVAVLHDHIITNKLAEFNAEALRRFPKWKAATTGDELGVMKEADQLHVMQAISVFGRNVREELEACLKYRNACGHPSSLKIVETRVVAHVETLIANVFESF